VRRVLGVCIVATTFALPAGAGVSASVANGRIGYLRPLGGNEPPYGHLFAVNPDGTGAADLTPAGYTDVRSFAWSPNGRLVAFSALQDGPSWRPLGVWTIRPDGRRLRRVVAVGGSPAFAPDGRWLAFIWNRDGNLELYKARVGGGEPIQLTNTYGITESTPRWQRAP